MHIEQTVKSIKTGKKVIIDRKEEVAALRAAPAYFGYLRWAHVWKAVQLAIERREARREAA